MPQQQRREREMRRQQEREQRRREQEEKRRLEEIERRRKEEEERRRAEEEKRRADREQVSVCSSSVSVFVAPVQRDAPGHWLKSAVWGIFSETLNKVSQN